MAHLTLHHLPRPFHLRRVGRPHPKHLNGVAEGGQRVAQFVGQHRQELVLAAVAVHQVVGPPL